MIDVNLHTASDFLRNSLLKIAPVYPITRKSHFRLIEGLRVTLSNYDYVVIPKGFQFDASSSPRFLWWLFPSYGDFFLASLIHDYLYKINYRAEDLGLNNARLLADTEMLKWSKKLNDRNIGKHLDNYLRFYAVRLFGKKVYKK